MTLERAVIHKKQCIISFFSINSVEIIEQLGFLCYTIFGILLMQRVAVSKKEQEQAK
jgi:hypothetical protein